MGFPSSTHPTRPGQGLLDEVQWCIRKRHEQEMNLAFRSKKDDAKAQFDKLQRAEDGKKALSEYEAEAVAVRAKTARLRALRLARDAAAQTAAAAQRRAHFKRRNAVEAAVAKSRKECPIVNEPFAERHGPNQVRLHPFVVHELRAIAIAWQTHVVRVRGNYRVRRHAASQAHGWSGDRKAYISHVWRNIRDKRPDWGLSEIESYFWAFRKDGASMPPELRKSRRRSGRSPL